MHDRFTSYLNAMLFSPSPSDEVSASEDWDYLVANDPFVNGTRHFRKGKGVKVHKNHVTIRHNEYDWVPNEQAIAELKALMAAWRAGGLELYADAVEMREVFDGEESIEESIYDSLGESMATPRYFKVPIVKVKFYKERPCDPNRGLAELIKEPRSNAQIVGLSVAP